MILNLALRRTETHYTFHTFWSNRERTKRDGSSFLSSGGNDKFLNRPSVFALYSSRAVHAARVKLAINKHVEELMPILVHAENVSYSTHCFIERI